MLKLFRKKIVMKIILWGLVIIIVPAFVMWGGASSSRSKDKGPDCVGFVDNRKVSFDEFNNAFSGVRGQIVLNYFNQPKVLEALLSNKPIMAKLAWDRILMTEEVKKAGIKISDKEVIMALRSHPLFLRNGVFDERFYAYILRNNMGLEPRAFEEMVRENLSLQRLSISLTKDIKLQDDEILSEYKKEFQRIKISYILLDAKDYPGGVEAKKMLKEKADEIYKKLLDRMTKKGVTFGKAAARMDLDLKDTDFFSKKGPVEAVGDAPVIVAASSGMKDLELSKPLEISKGYIIFEVTGRKDADEEAFVKDKEEFSKSMIEVRSNIIMEKWLKTLEEKAKLSIKLEDAGKYSQ